MGNGAADIT